MVLPKRLSKSKCIRFADRTRRFIAEYHGNCIVCLMKSGFGRRPPSAVSIQQVSTEPPSGPRVSLMKRKTYDRSIDEFFFVQFHKKRCLCLTTVTGYILGMQRNKNKSIMRLKIRSPARCNNDLRMFGFIRDNQSGFKNPRILLFSHSNIVFCQINYLFTLS